MLVRRACAEQVGIFDERYFAIARKGTRLPGRRCWLALVVHPRAMVRNPGMSASIERVAYLQLRNTS